MIRTESFRTIHALTLQVSALCMFYHVALPHSLDGLETTTSAQSTQNSVALVVFNSPARSMA